MDGPWPCIGYMQVVACQDVAMLLPIIQQHLHPDTIVHSDEQTLQSSATNCRTLRNGPSISFVIPATGTHTQTVLEQSKTKFKRMKVIYG